MENEKSSRAQERIIFMDWAVVLGQVGLDADKQEAWKITIRWFLSWCKQGGHVVSLSSARDFYRVQVSAKSPSEAVRLQWSDALRWFTENGCDEAREGDTRQPGYREPALAHPYADIDMGAPQLDSFTDPLVQEFVRVARSGHLVLKTERCYLGWLRRFVRWYSPKDARKLKGPDVEGFLSHLAAVELVAPATQKQALNALAFFCKRVLKRKDLDFSGFKRAKQRKRMPVVLTVEEMRALLLELQGQFRLMASVAYGGGLRLSELLRLRIKDVDFERE